MNTTDLLTTDPLNTLAAHIARKIFECGDEPGFPTFRIEFKTSRDGKEFGMGGLAEEPLMRVIKLAIEEIQLRDATIKPKSRSLEGVAHMPMKPSEVMYEPNKSDALPQPSCPICENTGWVIRYNQTPLNPLPPYWPYWGDCPSCFPL